MPGGLPGWLPGFDVPVLAPGRVALLLLLLFVRGGCVDVLVVGLGEAVVTDVVVVVVVVVERPRAETSTLKSPKLIIAIVGRSIRFFMTLNF